MGKICEGRGYEEANLLYSHFAGVTLFLDSTVYVEKVPPGKGEGIRRDDQEKMATEGSHSQRSTSENEGRGCLQQRHDRRGLNSTKGVVDTQR